MQETLPTPELPTLAESAAATVEPSPTAELAATAEPVAADMPAATDVTAVPAVPQADIASSLTSATTEPDEAAVAPDDTGAAGPTAADNVPPHRTGDDSGTDPGLELDPSAAAAAIAAAPDKASTDLTPAACAALLAQHFPPLFSAGRPLPIKLRIQADIQQRAPGLFNKKSLSIFLHRHTTSTAYIKALLAAATRFDLDGQPAGEIAQEHRDAAVAELDRRQAIVQARRAAERDALRHAQRESQRGAQQEAQRQEPGSAAMAHPRPAPDGAGTTPADAQPPADAPPRPARFERPPRGQQPDGSRPQQPAHGQRPPRADGQRPPRPDGQRAPRAQGQGNPRMDSQRALRPDGQRPPRADGQHPAHADGRFSSAHPSAHPSADLSAHPPARPHGSATAPGDTRPVDRRPTDSRAIDTAPAATAALLTPEKVAHNEARRGRAALLRSFETTTLTRANFGALKGMTDAALEVLLVQARSERPTTPPPVDAQSGHGPERGTERSAERGGDYRRPQSSAGPSQPPRGDQRAPRSGGRPPR